MGEVDEQIDRPERASGAWCLWWRRPRNPSPISIIRGRSYTPYETRSHFHIWRDVTEVYIGGDLEPRENLRHVVTSNGIRYFMGATRDGVGVDRLENYRRT